MLNKLFLLILITSLCNVSAVFAKKKKYVTKEKVGQEYYLNRCSTCHGSGSRGGNLYSIYEWKNIYSKNGKELVYLHEDEDDTQNIIKYIKSDDFAKEKTRMLKFIQEFAYDSETIPTCY